MNRKIENIIIKYLNKSITKKEWYELNDWYEKFGETKDFLEYVKIHYAIEDIMSEFDTEKVKELILKKISKDKQAAVWLKARKFLKYAAMLLILFSVGYFLNKTYNSKPIEETMVYSEETIILELGNGKIETLLEGETKNIFDASGNVIGYQKDNQLIYNKSLKKTQNKEFNLLTIPFGKRFKLKLSDGTTAVLNAGSSIKYPINFLGSEKREIIITGEVFLDVTKDEKRPFFVKTANNFDIQVIGTQFNVSNYQDDLTTEVVLLEGSVKMKYNMNDETLLEPGFKGSFNKTKKDISVKPVITNNYTSWMDGNLVFRGVSLETILKKLERHYGVLILNKNTEYSNKLFNANFGDEPLDTILNYFKKTYGIKYSIKDKTITIY